MGRITYREEVASITNLELPATFTAAEAGHHRVSRRELQRMLATGRVERVGRGVYRRADAELADYDLIEIAIKAHQPTLCLLSALARHELTDVIPSAHDIALPRGVWHPAVSSPVYWHKFDVSTFAIGREQVQLDETHSIGLYQASRSIIDVFRLRHEIGPEIAYEALRRWLRQGGQPAELMQLTRSFPAARPSVLHALQVLL